MWIASTFGKYTRHFIRGADLSITSGIAMSYTSAIRTALAVVILAAVVLSGCRIAPMESATDATTGEQEILRELNYVRTNPQAYAQELERIQQYFRGNLYQEPGQPAVRTREGAAAVGEAIRYLRSTTAMKPLSYCGGLAKAAADHVSDIGPKGMTSHTGSDGSTPRSRIERYGQWLATMGENIAYGSLPSARRIVMQLIIDDGVANRGHRDVILNPDYRLVGIATGSHKVYGSICVQEFAGDFRECSAAAGNDAL